MVRVYLVMTALFALFLYASWIGFAFWFDYLRFPLPEHDGYDVMYWAEDQNWDSNKRQDAYHKTQGTTLAPLEWLQALEQPKLMGWRPGPAPPFLASDYLAQLRILPNPNRTHNPEGLPVGLAVQKNFRDYNNAFPLNTPDQRSMVGMNCSFCHTAQLNYKGVGFRVDGGPSHVDVARLQKELGFAVVLTLVLRSRRDRFVERVLGPGYGKRTRRDLEEDLFTTARKLLYTFKIESFYPTAEGFGRLDALGRIGNFVFGYDTGELDNLREGNAPVHLPHIWDTGWFDWVQYNGSIRQPMMRNISEALGVYASVAMDSVDEMKNSSVPVDELHKIEKLLFGEQPYTGLRSPRWPEGLFGEIEHTDAEEGEKLYRIHCQKCHLEPIDTKRFWEKNWDEKDPENGLGVRLLRTVLVPVSCNETTWGAPDDGKYWEHLPSTENTKFWKDYGPWPRPRTPKCIGTDDNLVKNWEERSAVVASLNDGKPVDAGVGLAAISKLIADKYYEEQGWLEFEPPNSERKELNKEQIDAYNGHRPDTVRKPLGYRARPLNGIWATAPFLHNGSVPNLFELLSPIEERSTTFYTGSREFDPKKVGFSTEKFRGGFLFDTRERGNSNAGHEFRDAKVENGVLGPKLEVNERYLIIEYLKTLTGDPGDYRPDWAAPAEPVPDEGDRENAVPNADENDAGATSPGV